MSAHTPGPWKWLEHDARLVSADGAGVLGPWYDTETDVDGICVTEPDRHLIAAAPAMYDALECFGRAWEELADEPKRGGRQPGEVLYEVGFFKKMRAALALARGEVKP